MGGAVASTWVMGLEGRYLGQDVGSESLWKGPATLGSSTAWIQGWLNEGLMGKTPRGWGTLVPWLCDTEP